MNDFETLINMFAALAADEANGVDPDLARANQARRIIQGGEETLIQLGQGLFTGENESTRVEGYDIVDHVTHEMLTLQSIRLQEQSYLLRAILTALTSQLPADNLFEGSDPIKELEQFVQSTVNEKESVPA